MKRNLGALVVLVALGVLTGCGGATDDRVEDPASASPSATEQARGPEVVDIVSGTAAGGDVAETATVIEGEKALERYLEQFNPPFVGQLAEAVAAAAPAADRVIGLAVIEISCDQPPSATVTEEDGAYVVRAGKVVSPHLECYAPVTSVAVLDLPR